MLTVSEIYRNARWTKNRDFQRSVLQVRVRGRDTCLGMLFRGYRLVDVDGEWYELRCPQHVLFDLSNPCPPCGRLDTAGLLYAWTSAKRHAAALTRDTPFSVAAGGPIQTAISLFGPDMISLRRVGRAIDRLLMADIAARCSIDGRPSPAQPIRLADAPARVRQLLGEVLDALRADLLPGMEPLIPTFALELIGDRHPVWNRIGSLGDRLVFVGLSSIAHALSFYLTTGVEPHIVEFHMGGDPYRLARRSAGAPGPRWLTEPPPSAASIALVDVAYTGRTLHTLAGQLQHVGATVALFPKSHLAVDRADYVLFLDHFTSTQGLRGLGHRRRWYMDLLRSRASAPALGGDAH